MLFNPNNLPGIVRDLYKKGESRTGEWMPAVKAAIRENIRDTNKLTDMVFYMKNPEMLGRKINSSEKLLIAEWKFYHALVKAVVREMGARIKSSDEPDVHQYNQGDSMGWDNVTGTPWTKQIIRSKSSMNS